MFCLKVLNNYINNYTRVAIRATRESTAFCSSAPSALMFTEVPCTKPKVCNLNKLLALAALSPTSTKISDAKDFASFTN
jgi:hypothetical protein